MLLISVRVELPNAEHIEASLRPEVRKAVLPMVVTIAVLLHHHAVAIPAEAAVPAHRIAAEEAVVPVRPVAVVEAVAVVVEDNDEQQKLKL